MAQSLPVILTQGNQKKTLASRGHCTADTGQHRHHAPDSIVNALINNTQSIQNDTRSI